VLLPSLLSGIFKRRWRTQSAEPLLQKAHQLQREGDVAGARELCEGILSRDPRHAEAHCLLGTVYGQCAEFDLAIPHLRQAIKLAPGLTSAHIGLGNIHKLRGDGPAAETCYRKALALQPDSPAAHYNIALVLRHYGQHDAALQHLDCACNVAPAFDDAIKERTLCLIQLKRYDDAISFLRGLAAQRPPSAVLQVCLGSAWQAMHRPMEALACYEQAQHLGYAGVELFRNLGVVLQQLGRIEKAVGAYDRANVLEPDNPLPRFHRALARLLIGEYAAGWPDYELRLMSEDRPARSSQFQRWDGSALEGRTILVYGEQGLGDEIMFASCLTEIIGQAGHCVIECHRKLEKLFARSFPASSVYAAPSAGVYAAATLQERIDFEIPSGSLPYFLRGTAGAFPLHQGYLRADPARIAYWRQRLAELGPGVKIGISWRGGTHQTRSPLRSIPLEEWQPILRTPGVRWVNLQYNEAGAALSELKLQHGIEVTHWKEAIDNYDETAALVCALDLTISVCTAVVHLGGALGRPVWVMAPLSPEWRYGIAGETMTWYPSVRIFRQSEFGEWSSVILQVAQQLGKLACGRSDGRKLSK
jgi:tetratricopeptide (TPR) repeat protein